ncbi:superoxide dismutase family protein [Escherichia marmotae]|nr:superoxide dismutase family protein [Escherichia marmotae]
MPLTRDSATAETLNVPVNLVTNDGIGKSIGHITISDSNYGLIFTPDLHDLPPGLHGFHIHENASCTPGMLDGKSVAALAAGGHLDPQKTGKHLGPYDPNGHLGDLPANYADTPAPLGGGGTRIACAIVG